jgi:hypothetical protein
VGGGGGGGLRVVVATRARARTHTRTQPRNGRWQPIVIFGEPPKQPGGARPTLWLPPGTFTDAGSAQPVIFFVTNWCLEPGPGLSVAAKGCDGASQLRSDWHASAYQFNQALVGVDVLLDRGNIGCAQDHLCIIHPVCRWLAALLLPLPRL